MVKQLNELQINEIKKNAENTKKQDIIEEKRNERRRLQILDDEDDDSWLESGIKSKTTRYRRKNRM